MRLAEDISSQRGIAWRCADSLSLQKFPGIAISDSTPDHSSLTKTRQRLPATVSEQVFVFVLKIAAEKKLLNGKTVRVDSTTPGHSRLLPAFSVLPVLPP